jgi:signal recognition particle receptor subunit beta
MSMAVYNYAGGEVNIKIVYYGAGLSGKTTNLEHIYSRMPKENKGKMVSMKTRTDRTLFFDFLPIEVGEIKGLKTRFLLYTVPGQVYYNATRKLVLKGVDALVFVADSASDRMAENKESLRNLEENLNDLGMSLKDIPWVIQYNKRDLPDIIDVETLEKELNEQKASSFAAVATTGEGVYETFEGVARIVFRNIRKELESVKGKQEPDKCPAESEIDVEIMAKGSSGLSDSETDEGESFSDAEKQEEEHESVSEFVDSVLSEKNGVEDGVDLGATRDGYEEYGHVVDLNGSEEKQETEKSPSAAEDEKEIELISDPLEKLSKQPKPSRPAPAGQTATAVKVKEERTVTVPVEISPEDFGKELPVRLILKIKVRRDEQ